VSSAERIAGWLGLGPALHAALLDDRVVVRSAAGATTTLAAAGEPADAAAAPWRAPLARLGAWLAEATSGASAAGRRPRLRLRLGAAHLRWQVLPWPAQIGSPAEFDAYARLRLRAVHGAAADGWRLQCAPLRAGRPTPVCAVDEALLAALHALPARLARIEPHFSAAHDRWQHRLRRGSAWFAAVEPVHLTLALLHDGQVQALRSLRHHGGSRWAGALVAAQAQLALAAGRDADAALPVQLAGDDGSGRRLAQPGLVWLDDDRAADAAATGAAATAGPGTLARLALGT
jgi:hypothetical protein